MSLHITNDHSDDTLALIGFPPDDSAQNRLRRIHDLLRSGITRNPNLRFIVATLCHEQRKYDKPLIASGFKGHGWHERSSSEYSLKVQAYTLAITPKVRARFTIISSLVKYRGIVFDSQLYKFLVRRHILQRVCRTVKSQTSRYTETGEVVKDLNRSLNWTSTTEGHRYWRGIHIRYLKEGG